MAKRAALFLLAACGSDPTPNTIAFDLEGPLVGETVSVARRQ